MKSLLLIVSHKSIRLCDLATGTEIAATGNIETLRAFPAGVAVLSPGGQPSFVAVASNLKPYVAIHRLDKLRGSGSSPAGGRSGRGSASSPSGLVSSEVKKFSLPEMPTAIAMSPATGDRQSAGFLAIGCRSGGLYLWDATTGTMIKHFISAGTGESISHLEFIRDGNFLLVAQKQAAVVYNVAQLCHRPKLQIDPVNEAVAPQVEVRRHWHDITAVAVVPMLGGDLVATGDSSGLLAIWRLADGNEVATVKFNAAISGLCGTVVFGMPGQVGIGISAISGEAASGRTRPPLPAKSTVDDLDERKGREQDFGGGGRAAATAATGKPIYASSHPNVSVKRHAPGGAGPTVLVSLKGGEVRRINVLEAYSRYKQTPLVGDEFDKLSEIPGGASLCHVSRWNEAVVTDPRPDQGLEVYSFQNGQLLRNIPTAKDDHVVFVTSIPQFDTAVDLARHYQVMQPTKVVADLNIAAPRHTAMLPATLATGAVPPFGTADVAGEGLTSFRVARPRSLAAARAFTLARREVRRLLEPLMKAALAQLDAKARLMQLMEQDRERLTHLQSDVGRFSDGIVGVVRSLRVADVSYMKPGILIPAGGSRKRRWLNAVMAVKPRVPIADSSNKEVPRLTAFGRSRGYSEYRSFTTEDDGPLLPASDPAIAAKLRRAAAGAGPGGPLYLEPPMAWSVRQMAQWGTYRGDNE